jgi:hypothetical protein
MGIPMAAEAAQAQRTRKRTRSRSCQTSANASREAGEGPVCVAQERSPDIWISLHIAAPSPGMPTSPAPAIPRVPATLDPQLGGSSTRVGRVGMRGRLHALDTSERH